MGGQWVGPTQDRVLALIEELGLETFPTRTEGQNVIETGGRLRRYRGTIPKLSPLVLADLGIARIEARAGCTEGRSRRSLGSAKGPLSSTRSRSASGSSGIRRPAKPAS